MAQAEAEAESYRLKSQELTEELIKMAMIDKWDGQLPRLFPTVETCLTWIVS